MLYTIKKNSFLVALAIVFTLVFSSLSLGLPKVSYAELTDEEISDYFNTYVNYITYLRKVSQLPTSDVQALAAFGVENVDAYYSYLNASNLTSKNITTTDIAEVFTAFKTFADGDGWPHFVGLMNQGKELDAVVYVLQNLQANISTDIKNALQAKGITTLDLIEIVVALSDKTVTSLETIDSLNATLDDVLAGKPEVKDALSAAGISWADLKDFISKLSLADRNLLTKIGQQLGYIQTISSGGGGGGGGGSTVVTTPNVSVDQGSDKAKMELPSSAINDALNNSAVNLVLDALKDLDIPNKEVSIASADLQKLAESGKNVVIDYGKVQLSIPTNALNLASLPADAKVSISAAEVATAAADEALAKKELIAKPAGKVFEFTISANGSDVTFSKAIKVAFEFTDSDVAGLNQDKLGVYYFNETAGNWQYVGGKVNKTTKQIEVALEHFSKYAIMEYNKTFADVTSHWAKADVELLAAKHLVKGVTAESFKPEASVTRAEFAILLQRALGLKADAKASAKFKDVAQKDWFFEGIQAAANSGLITGYPDGSFKPSAKISREEMSVMMVRALSFEGKGTVITGDQVTNLLAKFKDNSKIGAWAKASAAAAVNAGIINGRTADSFVPGGLATRAEAVTMLKRILVKVERI